jgi:Lhr-like helicase
MTPRISERSSVHSGCHSCVFSDLDCRIGSQLLALLRRAWPYRNLTRADFAAIVCMLAEGFTTRRGRRGALIHHDAVNQMLRGRRGARLTALTSGGAIPENADYVYEDFAIESMAGDIFNSAISPIAFCGLVTSGGGLAVTDL